MRTVSKGDVFFRTRGLSKKSIKSPTNRWSVVGIKNGVARTVNEATGEPRVYSLRTFQGGAYQKAS